MKDVVGIREEIANMATLALAMLKDTFDGFMQHDRDILAKVLKDEARLNEMQKAVTLSLVALSKSKAGSDKADIMPLVDIAANLEEIGDYIKDMIERIEIKIEEKLLFSDDALAEYKHLYSAVETELADLEKALKMNDGNFARRILCNDSHVDKLVQQYREAHARRLLAGVCQPLACNMFLNLLDFTAQISHHNKAIARIILKLK